MIRLHGINYGRLCVWCVIVWGIEHTHAFTRADTLWASSFVYNEKSTVIVRHVRFEQGVLNELNQLMSCDVIQWDLLPCRKGRDCVAEDETKKIIYLMHGLNNQLCIVSRSVVARCRSSASAPLCTWCETKFMHVRRVQGGARVMYWRPLVTHTYYTVDMCYVFNCKNSVNGKKNDAVNCKSPYL